MTTSAARAPCRPWAPAAKLAALTGKGNAVGMRAAKVLWARLLSAAARVRARRKHPRRASNLAIDWRVFGSRVHHISALADLSPGGAFVRAAYPRAVGSPITLDLPTARGKVNVHARVAWCSAEGMGLRFTRSLPSLA